jgi:hypothetical protein
MPPSAHDGTLSANIQMGGRPWIWLELMLNTCACKEAGAEMARSHQRQMLAPYEYRGECSESDASMRVNSPA